LLFSLVELEELQIRIGVVREEGKTNHVLCASIAPDYARMRDDFSAVMLLPEETKPAGGKVDD
jgi:hypothetical protein